MYLCWQEANCPFDPRFYREDSCYVHGGFESSGKLAEAVYGRQVGARILLNTQKTCTPSINVLENTQFENELLLSGQVFDSLLMRSFASLRKFARRLRRCSSRTAAQI